MIISPCTASVPRPRTEWLAVFIALSVLACGSEDSNPEPRQDPDTVIRPGDCSATEYLDGEECKTLTVCGAGEYVVALPTGVSDRRCSPCEDGTYSDDDNRTACQEHTTCPRGTYQAGPGTPESNSQCDPCPEGTFAPEAGATECTPFGTCSAGNFVTTSGSAQRDRECSPCEDGSYTSEDNESQCTPHEECPWGTIETAAGTSTTATACQACQVGQQCLGTRVPRNCRDGKWDHDADPATACEEHTECPANEEVSTPGTGTTDNECSACLPDASGCGLECISSFPVTLSVDLCGRSQPGERPSLSSAGDFVAFTSESDRLVLGDTNQADDVFVMNTKTGEITRISESSDGAEGDGASTLAKISKDGRYVVFLSEATNLVADDTNGVRDVFLHDRQTGETRRVSLDSDGGQANGPSPYVALSPEGRYVAFASEATNLVAGDTNQATDVFLHDTETGETLRVSVDESGAQGNGPSSAPSVSEDGHFIAFASEASNLVADDTNGESDVFVFDSQSGAVTRASVDGSGVEGDDSSSFPDISANGRYVAFSSRSFLTEDEEDWVHSRVFVHDTQTGALLSVSSSEIAGSAVISSSGRYVGYSAGGVQSVHDFFVYDVEQGTTTKANPGIGSDKMDSPVGMSFSYDESYLAFGFALFSDDETTSFIYANTMP